ncbi:serine/arginine repetitive matrix protein 2 isoform X2 [Manduca sexta]|uniref:Chascon n=1 Tax=Manduca sexta TaxID=7130 RepID=A0A921YQU6_MANSE|nr:serine/arginine repetitive matrix protein 2 isoform X2 [Manduca sexta]KAG6443685.1 hypothetical protein O3G_MSEX003028 [Manduca sexta]
MPIAAVSRETPPASPPLQPATYEEALATAEPGDTIATTKEEEWVTRKTSEVTTTRQIATRVKRELILEDGRILSDSGPKISTSVNEDTHTTNFQQTEHRVPDGQNEEVADEVEGAVGARIEELEATPTTGGEVAPAGAKVMVSSKVVANPDGKVRESHDKKILTRNITERVRETEERIHRGDTTHEALIAAVNETKEEDIRDALKTQTEQQLALVPRGPTVVKDTVAYNTTINTDDTEELRALRPDGTIVTETRHTKEQERICDEELSKEEAKSLPSDKSIVEETGGTEKRKRVDLETSTDLMAGGLRVAHTVHSKNRIEEVEREGQPNMDDDWDSLSVRMRRQRRLRHADPEKDYKRPVDFDIEEETRKKETSKWLESHFGSESRSSHDSIAEEIGQRPEPTFYKNKTAEDEGYYGKTSSGPPPPVYGDRVLRKTKSSTPSDERPAPVNRTGGYFKGVADWSQRRATKPRMPEPRSSSPSPPAVRSPYASDDRLNGSSPKHVYGKRDSPQGRSSPIGRRHPPSRDDSAYVSSSTMHSPPRGSPFRPLETDRSFREPSVEDDYRPMAPERKRQSKQRLSEDHRYDSGYRSSSRNENSGRSRDSREEGATEPPPDYSPPRERRESSDRDRTPPRRRDRDERKQNQKTRFADNGRRPSPARKSVGSAIGNSIRKLVGKIRSASAERRAKWRNSRTPSPEHSSRTYKQYGGELAPPTAPPHRYYLGEDPFAPSIYGREHKYEGSSRRAVGSDARDHREHRDRGQFSSTLGRFSHSTSRLNPNSEPEEDYTRSAQTLPRKLHERKEKAAEKPSSNKYWHRLTPNKRSTSAVNVSNNVTASPDGKINGYPPGPAKPARTYKALNRSKSFAMGAPEQETTHPRYVSTMNRNYSTMYKSNPHLSRLDETPEQLKSPGIVSIINRSQRDLADAVSRETERRRDGLFGARYGKTTPMTNGSNGYSQKYEDTDKKKIFLKGLRERAPDLYQTLHADEESDGSRLSSRYGTPSPHYKERVSEERVSKTPLFKTESLNRETSPFVSRLETRLKSPAIRRGSNSSDNYSETYRYTTRSGDPERPSVTDTVETVSKKIVPSRDGRSKEIIESREINSVTKSRGYKAEPAPIKYIENGNRPSPFVYESKNGPYTERKSSSYKVTEKVRDY